MKFKTDEELREEFPFVDDNKYRTSIVYGSVGIRKNEEEHMKDRQKRYDAEMYESRKRGDI